MSTAAAKRYLYSHFGGSTPTTTQPTSQSQHSSSFNHKSSTSDSRIKNVMKDEVATSETLLLESEKSDCKRPISSSPCSRKSLIEKKHHPDAVVDENTSVSIDRQLQSLNSFESIKSADLFQKLSQSNKLSNIDCNDSTILSPIQSPHHHHHHHHRHHHQFHPTYQPALFSSVIGDVPLTFSKFIPPPPPPTPPSHSLTAITNHSNDLNFNSNIRTNSALDLGSLSPYFYHRYQQLYLQLNQTLISNELQAFISTPPPPSSSSSSLSSVLSATSSLSRMNENNLGNQNDLGDSRSVHDRSQLKSSQSTMIVDAHVPVIASTAAYSNNNGDRNDRSNHTEEISREKNKELLAINISNNSDDDSRAQNEVNIFPMLTNDDEGIDVDMEIDIGGNEDDCKIIPISSSTTIATSTMETPSSTSSSSSSTSSSTTESSFTKILETKSTIPSIASSTSTTLANTIVMSLASIPSSSMINSVQSSSSSLKISNINGGSVINDEIESSSFTTINGFDRKNRKLADGDVGGDNDVDDDNLDRNPRIDHRDQRDHDHGDGDGDGDEDADEMKENRKRRKRSNRKSSESILYQCTWPGCNFKCFQCSIIEQHVRVLHLGREQLINGDGEASKTFTKSSSIHPVGDEDRDDLSDVHEEEFYYNETKLTNGFKEIEIEIDDGGEEEIDEVTNHHSPLTSSTSAVSSLSPMSSSSMNINGNDLQTPSTGTTMTTTTAKMITSQLNLASSKQFVSESINDGPIDLSRSRSSTDSPSTIPKNGINTGKSNLLLVKNDNFALGLPPPPPPQPSATNQSNSMMMSKLMLTSIIPSNMFHRNFSSASPSSMSSSSSSSSSSSAYFSSNSSPTSSTKSWSAHYDLASYKNSDEHSNSNAKISRDLVQYGKKTSTLINGNQIVPTTKPIVVLQHKSSNVIKYGLKSGDNINLINQTSSILSSKKNENSLSKFMNPLDHFDLLNHQSLTLKTSNNSKVPVKVKTNSATKTDRSSSMISNGPRRRGRPPGSTNKKKKLLQPQQLICAMNPLNGTPFIASIAASLSTNVPHQTSCLNLEKSAFHPHPKSFASIDSPSSTSQPNLFGSINNLMVSASSSSIASSSSHQLLMNGSNATLARRPRGESRKCRKVYGMDNRQLWCTQCKWKKACSRFID